MLPTLLLPDTVTRQDGVSADLFLEKPCKALRLTLGINRILEQECLEVSVWGSSDQQKWRKLGAFPQKFYCGTYPLTLDLTPHQDIRYLRAHWQMGRWANADRAPLFGFYLRVEEGSLHRASAA